MESLFVSLFREYGILPVFLFLIAILWFLLREIKNEFKLIKTSLKNDIDKLKDELEKFKQSSDAKDEKLTGMITQLENRIACVEKEYVSKNDHYRDLGGWREELREIRKLILSKGDNR